MLTDPLTFVTLPYIVCLLDYSSTVVSKLLFRRQHASSYVVWSLTCCQLHEHRAITRLDLFKIDLSDSGKERGRGTFVENVVSIEIILLCRRLALLKTSPAAWSRPRVSRLKHKRWSLPLTHCFYLVSRFEKCWTYRHLHRKRNDGRGKIMLGSLITSKRILLVQNPLSSL